MGKKKREKIGERRKVRALIFWPLTVVNLTPGAFLERVHPNLGVFVTRSGHLPKVLQTSLARVMVQCQKSNEKEEKVRAWSFWPLTVVNLTPGAFLERVRLTTSLLRHFWKSAS